MSDNTEENGEKQASEAPQSSNSEKMGITKGASTVAFFTMISRVAGLIRDTVLFHIFGATGITDAFFIAFTIPNVLRRFVAEGALTVAFVPVYTDIKEKRGQKAGLEFFAKVLGLVLCFVSLLALIGIVFAPAFVLAFASGFADKAEQLALTVSMTRFLFPYVLFISLVALAMGILNAHRIFASSAAAPIFLNLSMIGACLFLTPYLDEPIYALVIGVLVGGIAQWCLQWFNLHKNKLWVMPRFQFRDPDVARLVKLLLPTMFGLAVYQINIIVLRQLASYLPEGHISYYYNGDRLMQLAFGVFAIAIATASFPTMSEQASRGEWEKFKSTWRFSFRLTMFITVPAALGLAAIALPIVSVLYVHGAFTAADAQITAYTAMAFAPGLLAMATVRNVVQTFYALEDTKTPVKVATLILFVNLALGLLLIRYEVVGLALSLSLSTSIQALILLVLLRRRIGALGFADLLKAFLGNLTLGLLAVGAAYGVSTLGDWPLGLTFSNVACLGASLASAVMVYGAGSLLLKQQEALTVLARFKR